MGKGLIVTKDGLDIDCGGSGLYCFVKGCEDNSEKDFPLYYINEIKIENDLIEI
jgi:hypothetical protein